MLRKQYSLSGRTPHEGQYKHYPQHITHNQDAHPDTTNDATFNSKRGNTESPV